MTLSSMLCVHLYTGTLIYVFVCFRVWHFQTS
jgi:hypothetical protein